MHISLMDYVTSTGGILAGLLLVHGGLTHLRHHDLIGAVLGQERSLSWRRGASSLLGVAELAAGVALTAASFGLMRTQWPHVVAAVMYLGFSGFLVLRLHTAPGTPCGCSFHGRVSLAATVRAVVLLAVVVITGVGHSRGAASNLVTDSLAVAVAAVSGVGAAAVAWILPQALEPLPDRRQVS